jgi:hypothetical protein
MSRDRSGVMTVEAAVGIASPTPGRTRRIAARNSVAQCCKLRATLRCDRLSRGGIAVDPVMVAEDLRCRPD